jgi:hypothetical protein
MGKAQSGGPPIPEGDDEEPDSPTPETDPSDAADYSVDLTQSASDADPALVPILVPVDSSLSGGSNPAGGQPVDPNTGQAPADPSTGISTGPAPQETPISPAAPYAPWAGAGAEASAGGAAGAIAGAAAGANAGAQVAASAPAVPGDSANPFPAPQSFLAANWNNLLAQWNPADGTPPPPVGGPGITLDWPPRVVLPTPPSAETGGSIQWNPAPRDNSSPSPPTSPSPQPAPTPAPAPGPGAPPNGLPSAGPSTPTPSDAPVPPPSFSFDQPPWGGGGGGSWGAGVIRLPPISFGGLSPLPQAGQPGAWPFFNPFQPGGPFNQPSHLMIGGMMGGMPGGPGMTPFGPNPFPPPPVLDFPTEPGVPYSLPDVLPNGTNVTYIEPGGPGAAQFPAGQTPGPLGEGPPPLVEAPGAGSLLGDILSVAGQILAAGGVIFTSGMTFSGDANMERAAQVIRITILDALVDIVNQENRTLTDAIARRDFSLIEQQHPNLWEAISRLANSDPDKAISLFKLAYGQTLEAMVAETVENHPFLSQYLEHLGGANQEDFKGLGSQQGLRIDITTVYDVEPHKDPEQRPTYGENLVVIPYVPPWNGNHLFIK